MDGFAFQVEVIRSDRRRSATIQLEHQLVKVKVPKTLSEQRIRDLIIKRTCWINTKLKEIAERPAILPKQYVSGEAIPYLGKNYRLKVLHGDKPSILMKNGYLMTTIKDINQNRTAEVRALVVDWYKKQATHRLQEKTKHYAKIIGVSPQSVTIKDYQSRWGSCSANREISFNWRIILASHKIIDYVVVHELCHILEHNHSPQYWRHVERYIPHWKERKEWLKNFTCTI